MTDERRLEMLARLSSVIVEASGGHDEHQRNAALVLANVKLLSPEKQSDLDTALRLLGAPGVALPWTGSLRSIIKSRPDRIEKVLADWTTSPLHPMRQIAGSLIRTISLAHYGKSSNGKTATWSRIGYPGPPPLEADVAPRIPSVRIQESTRRRCEYLIIGSGAGGGVAAGLLAEAGKDVVVVERGPHFSGSDFSRSEGEMLRALYDRGGLVTSEDGSVNMASGNCVGGGTTVNWSASFRLPGNVRERWRKHGVNMTSLDEAYDAVEQRISVHTDGTIHNPQNAALLRGCEALGYETEVVPRNQHAVPPDQEAAKGFSCLGDPVGTKRSTLETYLRSAQEKGATIISNALVERLKVQSGRIRSAMVVAGSGTPHMMEIEADHVILAAGALNSAVVLLRSGYQHPGLGQHLHLHPTSVVPAIYEEDMSSWYGNIMSSASGEFYDLGEGHGFLIETAPVHPGFGSVALAWRGREDHARLMDRLKQVGVFVPLLRDRDGGRISISKAGHRRIDYRISDFDRKHAIHGLMECARVHFAAGAEEVVLPHHGLAPILRKDSDTLEEVVRSVRWDPCSFPFFSAHQMGAVCMGADARVYPVDPEGRLRGVSNCLVVDGSIFPEASGVNPMLTIMAMAHGLVQGHLAGA